MPYPHRNASSQTKHPPQQLHLPLGLVVTAVFGLFLCSPAEALDLPRVLPEGTRPDDSRLGDLRTLDDYSPFLPPDSLAQWEKRSERVRRQILVAAGLWPMPPKTPVNAVVHGRIDRGDYTLEKVYLESFPGFFVTGNLYRPVGRSAPGPAVLSPHGHWAEGRFYDAGQEGAKAAIASGAETLECAARSPLQARCVQLARMGCTVFHYDMIGYADSQQLPHRPGVREAMNTPTEWGLFSPQAELHSQNMLGLQTLNSIRALDWLASLPEVDPKRIGVTGASGGGTQTFLLCAVDPRPAVSFPAVMVSTGMQGGCTCENACYLRIGTGNVEFAALFAPKPLAMSGADDWTRELLTKGLPELQQLYALFGARDHVHAEVFPQFPHNYNAVARAVMYRWFNRHLELRANEPIEEHQFERLSREEMTVWNEDHPAPLGGEDFERDLLQRLTESSQEQVEALIPDDQASWEEYRRVIGGAIEVLVGRGLPGADEVSAEKLGEGQVGEVRIERRLVRYQPNGEELPALRLMPEGWSGDTVVWISTEGKSTVVESSQNWHPVVQQLLRRKAAIAAIDMFGQGEFTDDGRPIERARMVEDGYAGYTFGYNRPVFAKRVGDVLTAVRFAQSTGPQGGKVHVVGLDGAGRWVAAARTQAGNAIARAAIATDGFRFSSVERSDDPDFWPGAAKYLDLPGVIALSAPWPTMILGEPHPPVVDRTYAAAGVPAAIQYLPDSPPPDRMADWLLGTGAR